MVNEDRKLYSNETDNNVRTKNFDPIKVAEGVTILVIFAVVGAAYGVWVRVNGVDVRIDKAIADNERRITDEIRDVKSNIRVADESNKLIILEMRKDLDVVARDLTNLQDECSTYQQWQTGLYRNSDKLNSLLTRFDDLFSDFREHEKATGLHK